LTEAEKFKADLVALLPRFRRFGFTLTGSADAADELVQDACERALSRFHQWLPDSRLDSWVYSIMHSIRRNDLRARRVRAGTEGVGAEREGSEDGRRQIEARLLLNDVDRAIGELPEGQRSALLLVCVEGYSYREAAELLAVPVGTVMSRLARARVSLADRFDRAPPQTAQGAKGSA